MATVAERQAERERRRREAEERKKREELAKQPGPDQVTVVGGDPNFQLGGGTFSILGIVENQALGGAQVISDQVQFKNANDQRQFGGVVNQVVGGQPDQQNNQQAGQQPAGPNGQPNNQQAGVAGVQPGQEKPAAEGDEPPDLLKLGAGLADEDDVEVEVNLDNKGGKSRHRDFVNFLARDEVPDSIFGIPIVQDESQYTEKDLEFFRRNPKAAGFYDLGDEEADEDAAPPVMDLFGGDTEAYREAFAQKRQDLVNSTAERQYKALLKFKDPDHRRRVEGYLYAALDSDARNATLLDEYNRLAEANRPRGRRGQALYDEMVERGRGRFAGGAWEKALGELISPDWVPPAEAPVAQARQGQPFVSRAKEALNVAKELSGLIAGGAERYATDVKETVSAAGAVLAAPKVPGVEMYDPTSGAIRDGKTGRIKRTATDRDRADIHEVNKAIGVRQALGAGNTRGAYPGSLNNPGNVEKRKERRQGEVDSPHERWAKFATPQDGLREMADAIRQIAAVKLSEKGRDFTIRNFAEVYAPRVNEKGEKENDTDKYIRDLSADTGFDADEELARWDEGDMARFLRSVVKFESGAKHSAWFTDEEYAAAAAKLQEGAFE